ncbi:hypothetical protein AYI68_g4843 [Smittium mucronatum]|uniref:Uncharacterized protein n=1 Tax=Smittium mucronatum TaxID=133383 RepID=A0A1R0GW14_9FUNG|nr:hypothetical protein AYI68_g4843 [Smittium mucronatum]
MEGKCPICLSHMERGLELLSSNILLGFSGLNLSLNFSALEILSINLVERFNLRSGPLGIYFLGGNPGGHPRTTQMGAEEESIVKKVSFFCNWKCLYIQKGYGRMSSVSNTY